MIEKDTVLRSGFLTPDGRRLHVRAYVFLVILSLAFFIQGFSTLPPTDRDESLFAQASKQMIESGNYIDIRFQDQPRYKKPVGIYWLQAASVQLLDPEHLNEIWAYRIPSLIGSVIAVVMTAAIGCLLFGPGIGFLSAIMMAGCLILNVEARLAKTDAALLGSIMVAQYALAVAYCRPKPSHSRWGLFFAFWTALSVGILLKGPIAPLIIGSTLAWLRVTDKNLSWFKILKPRRGLLYLLLLIMPWFVAILMASKGAFIQQSAGHDFLGKLWQDQGRGFIPPGAYLLALPVTFFPFGAFAWLAMPDSWKNRHLPSVRFCLGWIVPCWIIFEMVIAKLPHYTLPLYPAIALLTSKTLIDGFPSLTKRSWRWLPPLAFSIWLMIGTALALAAVMLSFQLNGQWNEAQIGAGLGLILAQAASLFFILRKPVLSVSMMSAGVLVFYSCLFCLTLPNLQHLWLSRDIVDIAEKLLPCKDSLQLVSNYNEPSLVFLAGTQTELQNDGQKIADEMRSDSCKIGVVNEKNQKTFLQAFTTSRIQPLSIAVVKGMDFGHISSVPLTLYVLPKKGTAP